MSTSSETLSQALTASRDALAEAVREVGVGGLIYLYANEPTLMRHFDNALSASLAAAPVWVLTS